MKIERPDYCDNFKLLFFYSFFSVFVCLITQNMLSNLYLNHVHSCLSDYLFNYERKALLIKSCKTSSRKKLQKYSEKKLLNNEIVAKLTKKVTKNSNEKPKSHISLTKTFNK